MKLSIIIPVYNEAPFLRRCLDSVKASEDVEIIIIEDGSIDDSADICDEYSGKFKISHHETNWGVSMSRNHGLSISTGDYVTFLDSDDAMSKGGIETILSIVRDSIEPVIQFNHYRCYDKGPTATHSHNSLPGYYSLSNLPRKWAVVWNKAYKRDFIMENHIRFRSGQQFDEDRHFNLQCFNLSPKILQVAEYAMIKYFDNEQSICHTLTQSTLLGGIDGLMQMLKDEKTTPEVKALIREVMEMHWSSQKFKRCFEI